MILVGLRLNWSHIPECGAKSTGTAHSTRLRESIVVGSTLYSGNSDWRGRWYVAVWKGDVISDTPFALLRRRPLGLIAKAPKEIDIRNLAVPSRLATWYRLPGTV